MGGGVEGCRVPDNAAEHRGEWAGRVGGLWWRSAGSSRGTP